MTSSSGRKHHREVHDASHVIEDGPRTDRAQAAFAGTMELDARGWDFRFTVSPACLAGAGHSGRSSGRGPGGRLARIWAATMPSTLATPKIQKV